MLTNKPRCSALSLALSKNAKSSSIKATRESTSAGLIGLAPSDGMTPSEILGQLLFLGSQGHVYVKALCLSPPCRYFFLQAALQQPARDLYPGLHESKNHPRKYE